MTRALSEAQGKTNSLRICMKRYVHSRIFGIYYESTQKESCLFLRFQIAFYHITSETLLAPKLYRVLLLVRKSVDSVVGSQELLKINMADINKAADLLDEADFDFSINTLKSLEYLFQTEKALLMWSNATMVNFESKERQPFIDENKVWLQNYDVYARKLENIVEKILIDGTQDSEFEHHNASFQRYEFQRRLGAGSYGHVDEVSMRPGTEPDESLVLFPFARKAITSPSGISTDSTISY
jgi:sulfur transfer complex TusBCD TusB component (DsrH family)